MNAYDDVEEFCIFGIHFKATNEQHNRIWLRLIDSTIYLSYLESSNLLEAQKGGGSGWALAVEEAARSKAAAEVALIHMTAEIVKEETAT